MSETIGNPAAATAEPRREAYSFACLNCGHGWEQAYRIEHRAGRDGRPGLVYWANGVRVPSPLTSPSCPGCGGGHVRIMRAGRVATVDAWWHPAPRGSSAAKAAPGAAPGALPGSADGAAPRPAPHGRWFHLPFHVRFHRAR